MPVWENGRLYVAGGGDIFWGKNDAWLHCLALSRTPSGGISCERTWKCALNRHVMSTVAVSAGLVFIADTGRTIHCFDAASGSVLWKHETGAEFWASPLVADGKVYIGNRRGEFFILAAAREKKVLCSVDLGSPISATATAANGAVFVATMDRLIALVSGK
jgi:outer membrane protein assembly factor BamB